MRITHIVRRFGPVGGMEAYVYHLVFELLSLGHDVGVICESTHVEIPDSLRLYKIKVSSFRPRWKQMEHFGNQVEQLVKSHGADDFGILHSHERSSVHSITTFHGGVYRPGLFAQFSRRCQKWMFLERREVSDRPDICVVAVSENLRRQLCERYPDVAARSCVVWPGLSGLTKALSNPENESFKKQLVFVGTEWRRKGLAKAVRIFQLLRQEDSGWEFTIFGCSSDQVPREFCQPGISFLGWHAEIPFSQYSVLILPSKVEPFGMVVIEALASGVAVVMSSEVGASEIPHLKRVAVLDLNDSDEVWADAVRELDQSQVMMQQFQTWHDVARKYTQIYHSLASEID